MLFRSSLKPLSGCASRFPLLCPSRAGVWRHFRDRKAPSEMIKTISRLLFAIVMLWLYKPVAAQTWVVTASTRLSQFDDYNTSTYSSSLTTVSTDFSVTSTSSGLSAYAEALASPSLLHAFTSVAQGFGGDVSANATNSFDLTVIDSNALRQLGNPGDTSITLMLNFDANVEISVPDDPGLFQQAVTTAVAYISTSQGPSESSQLNVENGPYDYSYSGTGAFTGFSDIGGNAVISVPMTINFDDPASFTVAISSFVSSFGGILSEAPAITDDIQLSIPTVGLITLPDGTSITDSGVDYDLFPTTVSSVPEPNTYLQIACAFLAAGVVFACKKIRKARMA